MTARAAPRMGRCRQPGGGDGLDARGSGASDESPGSDCPGAERRADVAAGGRYPRAESAQYSPDALAVRAARLRRPVRRPAGEARAQAGARGRGRAHLAPVPRAVSGLQYPALLPGRPSGAGGHPVVHLCESAAAAGGAGGQGPGAGPASAPPGAPALLWRTAPSRRQRASVAGLGPHPQADPHRGGR